MVVIHRTKKTAVPGERTTFKPVLATALALMFVLAALTVICAPTVSAAPYDWYNDGSDDPDYDYVIGTQTEMKELANIVSGTGGKTADSFSGKTIGLKNDIHITGTWIPIGTIANPFSGTFDGAGKMIYNANAEIFTALVDATVCNLGVVGQRPVVGGDVFGLLAGEAWGSTVEKCFATGTVDIVGDGSDVSLIAGGLIGFTFESEVKNCYADANILFMGGLAFSSKDKFTGGLIGCAIDTAIEYCYTVGTITALSFSSTGDAAGGMVGILSGSSTTGASVTNCVALGEMIISVSTDIGRVVGLVDSGTAANITVANIYANDEMVNLSGLFTVNPRDGENGDDVSLTVAKTAAFWADDAIWDTSAWDELVDPDTTDKIWWFEDGKLPLLQVFVTNAQVPVISEQPRSQDVAEDGELYVDVDTFDLSVTASVTDGGVLTYQWYESTTDDSTAGNAISGATGSTYTASKAKGDYGTYYYYVIITNTNDAVNGTETATITSDTAEVTFLQDAEAPLIGTPPQNSSGYENVDLTLSVVASVTDNGTLTYQWYSNITGGTAISGATGSTYTFTKTMGTYYYYVVITNTNNDLNGVKVATTTSSIVTVVFLRDAETPTIDTQPVGASVPLGNSVTLTVAASVTDGGTLSYQWYSNTTNSYTGATLINGATSTTYQPSTATMGTVYYFVKVTNHNTAVNGDDGVENSNIVSVTSLVNAGAPTIDTQPLSASPKAKDMLTLRVLALSPDGGVLSYQWYENDVEDNTTGTAIAGATTDAYAPLTNDVGTKYYYVVITNTNTGLNGVQTASITSDVVSVTVTSPTDNTILIIAALFAILMGAVAAVYFLFIRKP